MTIAKMLAQIAGCIALHEPQPHLVREASAYRYGTLHTTELIDLLRRTRLPRAKGLVYCESNQVLSLIIPALIEAFPECRFIWLVRNGLDQVTSGYRRDFYRYSPEDFEQYAHRPAVERDWLEARVRGDLSGCMSEAEWASLDRFERCCWYWAYVNQTIENDLKLVAADRHYFVRLEELDIEFPSLLKWMGLRVLLTPRVVQYNAGTREYFHWTLWSEDQRRAFERQCGGMMDQLYPTWRTGDGDWNGIEYSSRGGALAALAAKQRLVYCVNRLAGSVIRSSPYHEGSVPSASSGS